MIDDTVPFHSVNLMSRWREENGFGSAFSLHVITQFQHLLITLLIS